MECCFVAVPDASVTPAFDRVGRWGAGVLAVLQGLIPAWLRRHVQAAAALTGDEPCPGTGERGVTGSVDPDSGDVACDGFMGSEERGTQA